MSDTPPPVNSVSDEGIAYQRALVARLDQAVLANPADAMSRGAAEIARRTLDQAIAATGWKDPATLDTRTESEKLHDRTFGIEPRTASDYALPQRPVAGFDMAGTRDALAKMSLDPMTGAALLRQIAEATEPVDVAAVKAHLQRAGKDYDTELAAAKLALDRAPGAIKPEQLDAHSLALLAIHGRQLAKHANGKAAK